MKICKRCGVEHPRTMYGKDSSRKDGMKDVCKPCRQQEAAEYYGKNRENILVRDKKRYHAVDEETRKARNRKNRERYLQATYNLSSEQIERMRKEQNNKCDICEVELGADWWQIHTDHCHTTGKVRGLLCNDCNRGLGGFKDSLFALDKAMKYLRKHT